MKDVHYIFSKCLNDGDISGLLALFDAGLSIDFRTQSGKTPLIVAIENDKMNIVNALIIRDADINAKTDTGKTPLMAAIENEREAVAHWFLDNGADISPVESDNGDNSLIIAVRKGYMSYVSKMIERGADINHKNHAGLTALDIARKRARKLVEEEKYTRIAQAIEAEISRRKTVAQAQIKKLGDAGMPVADEVIPLPRIRLGKGLKL